MSKVSKTLVDHNLVTLILEVEKAVKDGWSVDIEGHTPGLYGFLYEVVVVKDESLISDKMTTADATATARSAKKLKALAAEKAAEE